MKLNATDAETLFRFPLKRGLSYWYSKSIHQIPCEGSKPPETVCYIMVSLPLAFSGLWQGIHTEGHSHPSRIQNLINNFYLALAAAPFFTNISPGSVHAQNFSSLFSLTLAFLLSRRLLIIFWLWCLSSFVMIIAEFFSCHLWAWINGRRLPLCHIGSTNSPSSLNEAPLASLSISCLSCWALDPLLGQSIHHSSNQSLTHLYHAWMRTKQKVELCCGEALICILTITAYI